MQYIAVSAGALSEGEFKHEFRVATDSMAEDYATRHMARWPFSKMRIFNLDTDTHVATLKKVTTVEIVKDSEEAS